jgi:hypothetical protein
MIICITLSIGCYSLDENNMNGNQEVYLLEEDYYVFSNENGRMNIEILNEDVKTRLLEVVDPVIFLYFNGDVKVAKGMTPLSSALPQSCDYIFWIDRNKKTVLFNNTTGLLVLNSINNYRLLNIEDFYKSLEGDAE